MPRAWLECDRVASSRGLGIGYIRIDCRKMYVFCCVELEKGSEKNNANFLLFIN